MPTYACVILAALTVRQVAAGTIAGEVYTVQASSCRLNRRGSVQAGGCRLASWRKERSSLSVIVVPFLWCYEQKSGKHDFLENVDTYAKQVK